MHTQHSVNFSSCDGHYTELLDAEPGNEAAIKASNLTNCLNQRCKESWEKTDKGIDFTHSRRLAWKTLQHLTGRSCRPTKCPISANSIPEQLLGKSQFLDSNKYYTCIINQETTKLWNAPDVDEYLSGPFSSEEISSAIRQLKGGKAHGPNNSPPEFMLHCSPRCHDWLQGFYSCCLLHQSIPKIWQKVTMSYGYG